MDVHMAMWGYVRGCIRIIYVRNRSLPLKISVHSCPVSPAQGVPLGEASVLLTPLLHRSSVLLGQCLCVSCVIRPRILSTLVSRLSFPEWNTGVSGVRFPKLRSEQLLG